MVAGIRRRRLRRCLSCELEIAAVYHGIGVQGIDMFIGSVDLLVKIGQSMHNRVFT